jgi:hypothetical protein
VVGTGDSLNVLAERHGTTVTTLRNLVRYTCEGVELWLARQLELSRG